MPITVAHDVVPEVLGQAALLAGLGQFRERMLDRQRQDAQRQQQIALALQERQQQQLFQGQQAELGRQFDQGQTQQRLQHGDLIDERQFEQQKEMLGLQDTLLGQRQQQGRDFDQGQQEQGQQFQLDRQILTEQAQKQAAEQEAEQKGMRPVYTQQQQADLAKLDNEAHQIRMSKNLRPAEIARALAVNAEDQSRIVPSKWEHLQDNMLEDFQRNVLPAPMPGDPRPWTRGRNGAWQPIEPEKKEAVAHPSVAKPTTFKDFVASFNETKAGMSTTKTSGKGEDATSETVIPGHEEVLEQMRKLQKEYADFAQQTPTQLTPQQAEQAPAPAAQAPEPQGRPTQIVDVGADDDETVQHLPEGSLFRQAGNLSVKAGGHVQPVAEANSQADVEALPSGAYFVGPSGKLRRKP